MGMNDKHGDWQTARGSRGWDSAKPWASQWAAITVASQPAAAPVASPLAVSGITSGSLLHIPLAWGANKSRNYPQTFSSIEFQQPNNGQVRSEAVEHMIQALQMPRAEMMTFDGDLIRFWTFIKAFWHITCHAQADDVPTPRIRCSRSISSARSFDIKRALPSDWQDILLHRQCHCPALYLEWKKEVPYSYCQWTGCCTCRVFGRPVETGTLRVNPGDDITRKVSITELVNSRWWFHGLECLLTLTSQRRRGGTTDWPWIWPRSQTWDNSPCHWNRSRCPHQPNSQALLLAEA